MREDQGVEELVVVLLEVFVGEFRVLSEDISCEVVVIVPRNGVSSPMFFSAACSEYQLSRCEK